MERLVLDSAPLSTFGRAGRLQDLDRLTWAYDRVTTRAVLDELHAGVAQFPALADVEHLPWLRIVSVDTLEELRLFAEYARRLGTAQHDVGEATVLAWAEAHAAVVLTDDTAAWQIGRERGVTVKRTLAVVARGVREDLLDVAQAEVLVDALLRSGARFPFGPGQFLAWARQNGILEAGPVG
jgi:predicted nucleic acid-binding protein